MLFDVVDKESVPRASGGDPWLEVMEAETERIKKK